MPISSSARAILDHLVSTGDRLNIKALNQRLPEVPDRTGAIEELLQEGLIWHGGRGRYAALETLGMEKGTIRSRSDGSAVLFTTDPESIRVSIDARDTGSALHGDTVLVRLLDPDLQGGYRGRVVHVLRRFRSKVAGIARKHSDRWFLDPLDPRIPGNIPIRTEDDSLVEGDLIGCSIEYGKSSLTVTPLERVGSTSSPRALIDSVCIDSGLEAAFAEDVLEEAQLVAASPAPHPARRDLRQTYTITIDPVDARDFDDAISIQRTDEGYTLGVHIADVSAYAPPGSLVDAEARKRGTSVYLPDRVIPMIPEVLSNGACSLQPDTDRLSKTVLIRYDNRGKRIDYSVFSSTIRSRKRLNYGEALDILEGGSSEDSELEGVFVHFEALNRLLDRQREKRGAVDLGASEFRTVFNDDGTPGGFAPVPDDKAHRMIENFMVEANRAVAEFCRWLELDVLYRVHGDPAQEAADKLRRTLSIFGFSLPGQGPPSASSLSSAVLEARDTPLFPLVRDAVLRSMKKAVYSPVNTGHYGLALRNYMHFTSPIRRYPDLIVHQAITAHEQGRAPRRNRSMAEEAESCSALERRAEAAERTATELMALLYLSGQTGEVFRGVIRDSVDFGLFVRLLDVPVEGLLHSSAMKRYSRFLPPRKEPGTPLSVSVESADPLERKLSLLPAENTEGETT